LPDQVGDSLSSNLVSAVRLTGAGMRYRPITTLGQGGMADVLLAVGRGPSGFNKLVVLKTMKKEHLADDELRQMFLAEARLSARLNNANVVHVHEVLDAALPCIVMEYLEGQTLSAILRQARERFTLPMQLKVLSEVLAGLHYSHELKDFDGTPLNLVHRDVSPQNIFITYDGVVKVLDFGIAKASNSGTQTRTGVVKGKLAYMACEQLLSGDIDRRADVYSIGCILWHAAAGQKLWADMPDGDVMRALIEGKPPRPSEVRPVDPRLEEIVMKALATSPDDRYSTALEMRRALDQYLAQLGPTTTMRDVGELVSDVFAEEQAMRARQIQQLLQGPYSEAPPPTPDQAEVIVATTATRRDVQPRGQLKRTVVAALLAAGVAAALVVGFTEWRGAKGEARHLAPVAPKAQVIQIRLTASPAAATLSVDGNPVAGNPALLTVPLDRRAHVVSASLQGFVTRQEAVDFDHDLSVDLALAPVEAMTSTRPAESSEPVRNAERHPVTVKKGHPTTSSAGHTANAASTKTKDCDPPYTFENGIKTYKTGCLVP